MAVITDVKAWYELEDANDSHTNNYHLTNAGSTTFAAAKVGDGASCDGTDDNLFINTTIGHDLNIGNNDFGVCGFFNYDAAIVGSERTIIGINNTDWIVQKRNNERLRFQVNAGAGNHFVEILGLTSGTWYWFLAEYNKSTETIRLLLDNATEATKVITGDVPLDRASRFNISGHNSGAIFDGLLDNFVIRKGSLWTPTELGHLFNSGNGITYAQGVAGFGSGLLRNKKLTMKLGLGLV